MSAFVDKFEDHIHGALPCVDRMLFRGCLPIMSGWSMAQLPRAHEIDCHGVIPFLPSNAQRVRAGALAIARQRGRSFEYPSSKLRKEDAALKLAELRSAPVSCTELLRRNQGSHSKRIHAHAALRFRMRRPA